MFPRELHETARPSSTAQWTALGRALELGREEDLRIVTDPYAATFLSASSRRLLAPLRGAGPVLRLAERSELAGIATSALCRHRFIDERLLEALPEIEQIVILGAGYDSRAYRFTRSIGSRPVYEVDLAPLSRRKAAVVAGRPDLFGYERVRRVEIDFRTQSLQERLAEAGLEPGARTFVVWEGVSMYLTRISVELTLDALGELCGRGSVVAMDFWRRVGGLGVYDQLRRVGERAIRLIGEPITFSVSPDSATAVLDRSGFEVADLATAAEMTRRHATAGRECDEGMFVVAARLR